MGLLDNILGRGQQQAAPNLPGILGQPKTGFLGMSGPTLMALGAGIASGDGIGDGLGKGLALASKTKAQERNREARLEPLRMTYKSLVADGVSPQDALLQTINPGMAKSRAEKKRKSDWQRMLLGKAPATSAAAPAGDFAMNLRAAESGGDDAARNPNSSATGRYQITDGTWAGLMQNYSALGLTSDGRTDPTQQEKALGALTSEYKATLEGAGLPVTDANLHATHFFGAGVAPKVLSAPDDALVSAYAPHKDIDANPFLQNMTIGQFRDWAAGKQGAKPVRVAQANTGSMIDGLTNPQRTLIAAAGPDKGLALLAQIQTSNAATAKTEQDKAKALNATKSLLTVQFPDQAPEWIDAVALSGQAGAFVSQALKAPKGAGTQLGKLKQDLDAGLITPEQYELASAKATRLTDGLSIRTNPDGTMEIVQGGSLSDVQQPTKSTTNALQKSLVSIEETLAVVEDLKKGFKPEYFTYAGAGKAGAARVADNTQGIPVVEDAARYLADQMGGDEKFLGNRRAYLEQVAQSFNAYRKEITGAAAAVQELEDLKKATLNADLGPTEFKASLDLLETKVRRSRAIKRQLLREGISVGDPRFGPRFDREYFAQGDGQETAPSSINRDEIERELQRRSGQ